MLLIASKDAERQGHTLKITNIAPEIEKIFVISGITELLA